jgi:hypothetical protein
MIVQRYGFVEWTDKDGRMRDVFLSARWRRVDGKDHLIYLYIGTQGVYATGPSVSPEFMRIRKPNHVHLYNAGIAFEGRPIPLTGCDRVWIHSKDRCLKPIPITARDQGQITPDTFFELPTTELWRETIEPVWERERPPD